MNYRSEVAAIKRLTKEIDQGDAAVEAAKWERAQRLARLSDEGMSQRDIVAETGLGRTTVQAAIAIWRTYGVGPARGRPRYAEADYQVQGRGPGFGNAKPTTIMEKAHHGDKVAVARQLLRDPKVASDVIREPATRASVVKASRKVDAEIEQSADDRERAARPALRSRGMQYELIGELTSIRYRLNRNLQKLRNADLDEEAQASVLEVVQELEDSLGWWRSFLESGDRSFDAALDRLLREGAGG